MKPFDLEAAKRGEPILYASMNRETFQPVHFVGQAEDGAPVIQWGKQIFTESESELCMAPKKRTVFANVWRVSLQAVFHDDPCVAEQAAAFNGREHYCAIAVPIEIEV